MKKYYLIISILLIFNCSTPYQPYGALGGYKSTAIDDNTFRVMFKGNQHTKAETVYNFLERRCAEIALENGCEYFIVFEDSSYIDKTVFLNEPELDQKIAAQRKDHYLPDRKPEIDTNPRQTLSDQKTKIGRTYANGTLDNVSTDVVGILKIKVANEIKRGFENHYLSAKQILMKYETE